MKKKNLFLLTLFGSLAFVSSNILIHSMEQDEREEQEEELQEMGPEEEYEDFYADPDEAFLEGEEEEEEEEEVPRVPFPNIPMPQGEGDEED